LRAIDDELIVWGRTFKKAFGTRPEPRADEFGSEEGDGYAEEEDGDALEWASNGEPESV
jgi:hypothetical protein